jgi:hypothetical protein
LWRALGVELALADGIVGEITRPALLEQMARV